MFEKDSEEYSNNWRINKKANLNFAELVELRAVIYKAHKDGAEFGYNKANEWHYVKDELPPSGETVLLYYGADAMGKAILSTGCIDCKGTWYKNVDDEPIKWQEITLPKESE